MNPSYLSDQLNTSFARLKRLPIKQEKGAIKRNDGTGRYTHMKTTIRKRLRKTRERQRKKASRTQLPDGSREKYLGSERKGNDEKGNSRGGSTAKTHGPEILNVHLEECNKDRPEKAFTSLLKENQKNDKRSSWRGGRHGRGRSRLRAASRGNGKPAARDKGGLLPDRAVSRRRGLWSWRDPKETSTWMQ